MKTMLAVIASASLISLAAFAEPAEGFFPAATSDVTASPDAQTPSQYLKQYLGCKVYLDEEVNGQTTIIDPKGLKYTFYYNSLHRLAEFRSASFNGVVVYEGDGRTVAAVIDAMSSRVLYQRKPNEAAWLAQLRADGKLPNAKKLIDQMCGGDVDMSRQAKSDCVDFEICDYFTAMTSPAYWEEVYGSAYDDIFELTRDPICEAWKDACKSNCQWRRNGLAVGCVAAGALASATGPYLPPLIAGACIVAINQGYDECMANCDRAC